VDNATTGADTLARLKALSYEIETVAKQGSLKFKETLISRDKECKDGKRKKVLGMICG
jgi:hypothetical protein